MSNLSYHEAREASQAAEQAFRASSEWAAYWSKELDRVMKAEMAWSHSGRLWTNMYHRDGIKATCSELEMSYHTMEAEREREAARRAEEAREAPLRARWEQLKSDLFGLGNGWFPPMDWVIRKQREFKEDFKALGGDPSKYQWELDNMLSEYQRGIDLQDSWLKHKAKEAARKQAETLARDRRLAHLIAEEIGRRNEVLARQSVAELLKGGR